MDSNREKQSGRRAFLQSVAAGILGRSVAIGQSTSAVSSWTGGQTNSVLNQARPANDSPLKITKVEPVVLRLNARNEDLTLYPQDYLMCRIETEEGIVGWGEGTNWPKVATVATEIEMNKHLVIGQSAWDIEKIWNTIFRTATKCMAATCNRRIRPSISLCGTSSGRSSSVPVYKLIGGKINEKLRIYTSYRWGDIPRTAEAYAKRTRELIAEGRYRRQVDPFFEPYSFLPEPGGQHQDDSRSGGIDPRHSRGWPAVRHLRGSPRQVQRGYGWTHHQATGTLRSLLARRAGSSPETWKPCCRCSERPASHRCRRTLDVAPGSAANISSARLFASSSPTPRTLAESPNSARWRPWRRAISSPLRRTTRMGRFAWRRICTWVRP